MGREQPGPFGFFEFCMEQNFHVPRRAEHGSCHTRHHQALPLLTLVTVARPEPPWAPTPRIPTPLGVAPKHSSWERGRSVSAEEVKRIASKKNLTPRPKGKVSVYFNSKMILIFFKQCPTWMSLSRIFTSRSCCTGAKPQRSQLYLCRTVPKTSQRAATTTTAQDSAQALKRRARVKN